MLLDHLPPIPGPKALRAQLRDTVASIRDTNRAGQAYAFLAITPIAAGRDGFLRDVLRRIDEREESPFARLEQVHFARWVVLDDFHTGEDYHPDDEDHLEVPYLIFSACVDGDRNSFLTDLANELADEAEEVWSHCVGVDAADPVDLRRYLLHNQIDSGLFYSAYPHTTAPEVRRVTKAQRELRALAVRRHELSPAELQAQFLERLGTR